MHSITVFEHNCKNLSNLFGRDAYTGVLKITSTDITVNKESNLAELHKLTLLTFKPPTLRP